MQLTKFMGGIFPNLPHLLKHSSEPGSSVPDLFHCAIYLYFSA